MRAALVALCAVMASACAKDESALAQEVEAALQRDPDVTARRVHVRTDGSTVVLTGEVETLLAKQEAVAVTRAVPGVESVIDDLRLEPFERSDEVLERRVAQALTVDPGTNLDVHVMVSGRIAQLTGVVDDPADIRAAHRIAASVPGIIGVIDDVRARSTVASFR